MGGGGGGGHHRVRTSGIAVGLRRRTGEPSNVLGSLLQRALDPDGVQLRHAEVRQPVDRDELQKRAPIHLVLGDAGHVLVEPQIGEERAHVGDGPLAQRVPRRLLPQLFGAIARVAAKRRGSLWLRYAGMNLCKPAQL